MSDENPTVLTDYGFLFGPLTVTRIQNAGQWIVRVENQAGQSIDVYASPTGKSLKAFRDSARLIPETP